MTAADEAFRALQVAATDAGITAPPLRATGPDDALRALQVAALAIGIPATTVDLIVSSVAPASFLTDDGEPDPARIATYLTAFTRLSQGARP